MRSFSRKTPSTLRYILTTAGYLFYAGANGAFFFVLPFLLILFPFKRLFRVVFELFFRGYLYLLSYCVLPALGVYRVVERSGFDALPATPVIFVANHRSRMEGPMLLSLLRKTGVIMKSSYTRFPVFASLVKLMDFISVDPHSIESFGAAISRCKELIGQAHSILIFPEGARARTSRLQPFKDLAFKIAIETNIPVVPLIVHSDYPFMAKIPGSIYPPRTMKFTLRMLPQIRPLENERPPDFAERVRRLMAGELRKLDAGTIWEALPADSTRRTT